MALLEQIKDRLRPYKHRLRRRPTQISWTRTLGNLKRLGYYPDVVFDIGVAHGTWELYDIYPKSHYYLCDPDERAMPYMEKISDHLGGRCHIGEVALADQAGRISINLRDDLQGNSFFPPADGRPEGEWREVRAVRFDEYYTKFPPGAFVKIDVQGAELLVLQGMTGAFHRFGAMLIEVSTLSTLDGSPEANQVIHFLYDKGFVLADIVGALRRPFDDQTAQMDLLFLPENSPLRRIRRW